MMFVRVVFGFDAELKGKLNAPVSLLKVLQWRNEVFAKLKQRVLILIRTKLVYEVCIRLM